MMLLQLELYSIGDSLRLLLAPRQTLRIEGIRSSPLIILNGHRDLDPFVPLFTFLLPSSAVPASS
jgi:hypothetical protein